MIADLEANGVEVRMDLNGQSEDVQKQWLAEADGFVLFSHSHASPATTSPRQSVVLTNG